MSVYRKKAVLEEKEDDDEQDEFEILFDGLNDKLETYVDPQFFKEPRRFKSILEVIDVVGQKPLRTRRGQNDEDFLASLRESSPAYARLVKEQKVVTEVIEEVVKFQHGGLNKPVDAMGEVISSYKKSQEGISSLRQSLLDIRGVLSPTKQGQSTLRELWEKKRLLEEQLRMLDEFETLFDAAGKVQMLTAQKKYMSAVNTLNSSITSMFGEDMVNINALSGVRDSLMNQKEALIESIVNSLKHIILGLDEIGQDIQQTDFEDAGSVSEFSFSGDGKSDMTRSIASTAEPSIDAKPGNAKLQDATVKGEAWSLDLAEVNESVEMALLDPTASVSVYIRLLVRAVHMLNCEDDVERMILDEHLSKSFVQVVNTLKRCIVSRKIGQKLDTKSQCKKFYAFTSSMLSAAFMMLKKTLHVMRLFGISKSGETVISRNTYSTSEHNKETIFSFWSDVENIIIDVLNAHFVETDVQDISNEVSGDSNTAAYVDPRSSDNLRDIFSDENDRDNEAVPVTICPPTVRLAAGESYRIICVPACSTAVTLSSSRRRVQRHHQFH